MQDMTEQDRLTISTLQRQSERRIEIYKALTVGLLQIGNTTWEMIMQACNDAQKDCVEALMRVQCVAEESQAVQDERARLYVFESSGLTGITLAMVIARFALKEEKKREGLEGLAGLFKEMASIAKQAKEAEDKAKQSPAEAPQENGAPTPAAEPAPAV